MRGEALWCAAFPEGALSGAVRAQPLRATLAPPFHFLHFISLHFTSLHFTSFHFTSLHSTFHNGGAASSLTCMGCKFRAGGSSEVCCRCRGRSFGGAQRASNACYLGGLLLPSPDHNLPGASAGSRHVRLFEAMGAWTLPGPKPAKKRPMCSPPGAGRKGRERSPHAHLMMHITGQGMPS